MQKLAKRLRYYRKKRGLGQEEVALQLGYKSFTTIQKWEAGTSTPSLEILNQLCEIYNVAFDVLVNGAPPLISIPILGTVRGGEPLYAYQENLGSHQELLNQSEYFYLKVVGNSMKEARICDGDEILVRSQNQLENGEIGVVLIGEEATVKRVFQNKQGITLQPENDDYQSRHYSRVEIEEYPIRILGKVIANRITIK